jgi:hypothetical protein
LFNSGIDGKERDFIISELDNKFSDKEFFIWNQLEFINNLYYINIVDSRISEINNAYILNSIYLWDIADEEIGKMIKYLKDLSNLVYSRFWKSPIDKLITEEKNIRNELDKDFVELKKIMKKEIFGK